MKKLTLWFLICWLTGVTTTRVVNAQQPHEPLVVIVSSQQGVVTLDLQQIEDLFLGRSTAFPDGSAAIPLDHTENSELWHQFYQDLLGRSAAQIRSHWARQVFTGRGRPPQTANSAEDVLKMIQQDARIISYIKASSVTDDIKVVFQ